FSACLACPSGLRSSGPRTSEASGCRARWRGNRLSLLLERYWNAGVETLPWSEVQDLQLAALRRQLAYVVERSPFYARKFAEAGFDVSRLRTLDDLRHAPFTTKEELRESQL